MILNIISVLIANLCILHSFSTLLFFSLCGEEGEDTETSNALVHQMHQTKDLRSSHDKAGHITVASHKPDTESGFELQPIPR